MLDRSHLALSYTLVPRLERLRTSAPAHTPLVLPTTPQPLLRTQLQLPIQLGTRLLPVYEIAKPTAHTALPAIEPTARFPKIRDGTQLAVHRLRGIPPAIQRVARLLRTVFVLEARVHVSDQVVVVVVADDDFLDLAVFAHLAPEVLVEGVEVVLELRGIHARFVVVGGVLVEVGEEDGLRVRGLDVFARAAVAVAACADFVVEGAVDFVLFRTEDGREIVGHGCG